MFDTRKSIVTFINIAWDMTFVSFEDGAELNMERYSFDSIDEETGKSGLEEWDEGMSEIGTVMERWENAAKAAEQFLAESFGGFDHDDIEKKAYFAHNTGVHESF